jgi:tetratricopeptide (TPR) repeat protein
VDAVNRPIFVEFTIQIVDLLAQIALKSGSLDEAKQQAIKALNMAKERFGEFHPETAKRLSELAKVHLTLKNYDQAKALHIKALEVDTKTTDGQNPALAERHMDIARVDVTREQPKDAMQSLAVARLVLDNVTEVEFPELAARLNSVGEMYMTLGQIEKAEPLFVQAVDIAERDHHSHKCLATYATNLATLCIARGRPVKALEYFTTALEMEEKRHGEMHLDVARACVNVGQVLFDMEEWKDAGLLYTRAMRIRSQKLGEDHDETLSCAKMIELAKERERSQHATGIVQARVAKYEDITAKSAESTPKRADEKPSEFAESKEKATPASADKTVTTMQRALQKLALLTSGAAERNKREAEEQRQSASKAQHLNERQNRVEELAEKTKARPQTVSRASEEPQESKPRAEAEKQETKSSAPPDEDDRVFEVSQKKHLPKLKGPVPVDEPKESPREKQRLIASPERQKRKLPRLITSPRKEEEKTARANFQEKKPAQSGDMNAFLSEYVEYSGHQRYRFKLDGMTMPSFRQIREYVEANFQDECRRWSAGENVERAPEPVKVVEEVPPRASPPSERVATEPEPAKTSPRLRRIFSEAPIVESPVSENTAPAAQQPQIVIETTPQSKGAFGSPAQPVANDTPALASEQYRMMFAKIDTLEKQLAETKAIMQQLLYDRALASPPQYLPPPPPPPLAIDYHQPMVAHPMDTGYTMNDGYSTRESEYFPTRTTISPRYALMYTPTHRDSYSPTSPNRTSSPHKPASRKLCRL